LEEDGKENSPAVQQSNSPLFDNDDADEDPWPGITSTADPKRKARHSRRMADLKNDEDDDDDDDVMEGATVNHGQKGCESKSSRAK
jgi:hypothetical protein